MRLYDLQGILLREQTLHAQHGHVARILVDGLAKGLYWVEVQGKAQRGRTKLVLQ